MTKSRQTFILIPLTILLTFCSGVILFIVYLIVIHDLSRLTDLDIIAGTVVLTWVAIFPLLMILSLMRNYVIHPDKLEVYYLFGLFKFFYDYSDLRIPDYSWTTKGILIQFSNGDQSTLGERQYKNYNEIKDSLESKIIKEDINIRYTTRFTRTMFV